MSGVVNLFLGGSQQTGGCGVENLLRAGCKNSYRESMGTSREVLRNKGIKNKHLQSGCEGLAFVGNWGRTGVVSNKVVVVVPLIQDREQVIEKAGKCLL